MKHIHTCPKCFEKCECTDDCAIEPDLGLSFDDLPKSSPVECPACSILWALPNALELCRTIEHVIKHFGFHVGLRGGVLLNGSSAHDLDLIIYPHDSTVCRARDLYEALCELGLERQKTVAQVHAGWRSRGLTDEKNIEIWTIGECVVDIFYAGFTPYVGPLKKYFVWGHYFGYPKYKESVPFQFDIVKYVAKYGQDRLDDRHTIEATDVTNAATLWCKNNVKEFGADYCDQTVVVYDENCKFVAIVDVELQPYTFKAKVRS